MSKFQNAFKSLRTREGLTQGEIAEKLGVTRSAVGNWEQGNREPEFEMLELIADYFNVDMNVLIGNTDKTYLDSLEVRQIANEIFDNIDLRILFNTAKDLDSDKLKSIIDFVKRIK
jgi:transcriptional regulator with XRE-family HTH domain